MILPGRVGSVFFGIMGFFFSAGHVPALSWAGEPDTQYGRQSVLPICTESVDPSMFSHPVRIQEKGRDPTRPHYWNVRWVDELALRGEAGRQTWVELGKGNRLMSLGFMVPVLGCNLGGAESLTTGYGFNPAALNPGTEVTLMEMPGRTDETGSLVRGQVTVLNKSYHALPGGSPVEDPFPPGVVNLVLSYSLDGLNYVEAGRSTAYVPSMAFSHKEGQVRPVITVQAQMPGAAMIKLKLIYRSPDPVIPIPRLHLIDARLFGTVCVPDMSNPGSCL